MLKTSFGPSELHLKRDLTTLQKARFLCDPENCSLWRSPLNSKPKNRDGMRQNFTGEINHGSSLNVLSRGKNGRQKFHLYNWRNPTKSIGRVWKLHEEDRKKSVKESPENNFNLSNSLIVDSKSDTCLEVQVNMPNVEGTNTRTPVKKTTRKFRRRRSLSKRGIKHSAASKLLDTASSLVGILDSGELSDDSEDYNSEDFQHLAHDLPQKSGYISHSASPFLHRSGYGSLLYSSKIPIPNRSVASSQSCTPASTGSYYKYGGQGSSSVGLWNGTAASFDGDELDRPELPKAKKCGIPCYWSKRHKYRGVGDFDSPSLSDTVKKKGSRILCGSQTLYTRKEFYGCHKQNYMAKSSQGLPLLSNSCDIGYSSLDTTSEELSCKLWELDLEALSRLDGRRWSSCKSQEGVEGGAVLEISDPRTLSQKYQPSSFNEIVGQNIVVQSLGSAISRGRIAPAYLFHGPRGTGKTSAARIFAAALNCLSSEEDRPCWFCGECTASSSRSRTNLKEVNATNNMGIDQVRRLLKSLSLAKTSSQYKVFIIDECHMLSSRNWSMFMKFLEEPLPHVVFIFITIEPGSLPHPVISQCQKYNFSKVKDADIVCRLRKLSEKENLDVELDALDLIALYSHGSLWDAETMLDQLSLLGKRITTSLVDDLVAVVPDEKLLDLLEIAMSSDTAETVKKSRELIDCGVDPIALMSQLAGLIMDIIAGTYRLANSHGVGTTLAGRSLTEAEVERLHLVLKVLSDAEKQLRYSSEQSTWFTAALLQLGYGHNLEPNRSSSSSKQSGRRISSGVSDIDNLLVCKSRRSHDRKLIDSCQTSDSTKEVSRSISPEMLDQIWNQCIHRCHSNTLRQLLSANGRLVSVAENEGILIAFVGFDDNIIKSRAERFLSSITNSMEIVLGHNVDVRIGLLPKIHSEVLQSEPSLPSNQMEKDMQKEVESDDLSSHPNKGKLKENKILHSSKQNPERACEKCNKSATGVLDYIAGVPLLLAKGNGSCDNKDTVQEISAQRHLKTAIDEQRLESAWLQAAEPGSVSQPKPDKNQVQLQDVVNYQYSKHSLIPKAKSLKHRDDALDHEFKDLKKNVNEGHHKEQVEWVNHSAISPSLLHCNNKTDNCDKESMEYESGPGCNGLLCWRRPKNHGGKVKHGIHASRLSLFGQCGQGKSAESSFRK